MAYKRQIDRLPIIPAGRRRSTTSSATSASSAAATRPTPGTSTGRAARRRIRTSSASTSAQQQPPETEAWYSPAMYNIVKQDGRDVHLVIKPDTGCVVNSGLGSIRGARLAERVLLARHLQPAAAADRSAGLALRPDDADQLGRCARRWSPRSPRRVIEEQGEDGVIVSAFDHGGAGGGYENTWGTGKLYFEAMKIKNIRIHNRPAYNSEVHATRDMGVGELNNCLRGRRARRHHRRRRHQRARDPDQLLPQSLGPEPARHARWTRSRSSCRASRMRRRGS